MAKKTAPTKKKARTPLPTKRAGVKKAEAAPRKGDKMDAAALEALRALMGSKGAEEEPDTRSIEKIFEQAIKEEAEAPEAALKWVDVECPYCGETIEVRVDPSEEGQEMVQDCQVCCKPVQMSVENEEGEVAVFAYRS